LTDKKIAVVGIPGKWSTEALADALGQKTGFRLVVDMADVSADITNGTVTANGVDLTKLDGVAVKKITETYSPHALDRLEMLRLIEARGVRVFSPALNMLRLIDRLACTVTLRNGGIPMPETRVTENIDAAIAAVKAFGAAVFKPLYSTKARGMTVIEATRSDEEMRAAIATFKAENPVMYIQKKLALSGQDLGLVFVGGVYHGAYARVANDGAWNTTIHSGGKYAPFECDSEVIDTASRAQALFDMDFTTVDVALTDQGPIVFEVSAFGGFRGAKEGIGIDAAALYADHILDALS
jgi:ribosomal protein S6--L-glutamate ligase